MNRRSFLRIFGAGLPAVAVAEKFGLIERVRSYFFAPKGGWEISCPDALSAYLAHAQHWSFSPRNGLRIDNIAAPSLYGIPYFISDDNTGTFLGLSRSSYPKVYFEKATLIG